MKFVTHRGFYAEKTLSELDQTEQVQNMACGHFIEDMDYFEREKLNLLKSFQDQSVDDDIYVLSHRDELA